MIDTKSVFKALFLLMLLMFLVTACFKIEPSITATAEMTRDTIPILEIAQYKLFFEATKAVASIDFLTDQGEAFHSSVRKSGEKTYIAELFVDSTATELTIIGRNTSGKETERQKIELTHTRDVLIMPAGSIGSRDGIYIKGDPLLFYSIAFLNKMTVRQRSNLLDELEKGPGGFVILANVDAWKWEDFLNDEPAVPVSENFLGTHRAKDMIDEEKLFNVITGNYILTLRIEIEPEGANPGTTDPAPNIDHEYDEGDEVIVAAIPEAGWELVDWTEYGESISSALSFNFTITHDRILTANFAAYEDFEIVFADDNLEQVIREAVNKPTGPIYRSDVLSIVQLSASLRGISDLSGIEYLENLTEFYFWGNSVSDLLPLVSLTSLEILDFWKNLVDDISAVAELVNLRELYFEDNAVEDLSPLAELTNLEVLAFHTNNVVDLEPLAGLSRLQFLDFFSNSVSDLSPLAGLVNLEVLYLDNNSVKDLSAIGGLENLVRLWADENLIEDISPLSGLVNLVEVFLTYNEIYDIGPLVDNLGISSGDIVDIRHNYLDLTPGSKNMEDIQKLVARGVIVEYVPQRDPLASTEFHLDDMERVKSRRVCPLIRRVPKK